MKIFRESKKLPFLFPPLFQTIMEKVLGHLRFWSVLQFTQVQPLPNNVGRVYPEFFPSFNFV